MANKAPDDQEHHEVGGPDRSPLEHPESHQGGLGDEPLVSDEPGDERGSQHQGDECLPRTPADARRAHDTEDERREAGGDKDGAEHVERLPLAFGTALLQERPGDDEGDDPDRDVDEQDPAPRQLLGEDAAKRAPAAPPAPATALHMPMARARAWGSRKVVVRIVKVAGDKIGASETLGGPGCR